MAHHKTYEDFLDVVEQLDFIDGTDMADAAIKTVLGIMVSRIDEEGARKLTSVLPGPLTFDRLRGHQVRELELTVNEYIDTVSAELDITREQSRQLIETVFRLVKEHIGPDNVAELEVHLPFTWAMLVERV